MKLKVKAVGEVVKRRVSRINCGDRLCDPYPDARFEQHMAVDTSLVRVSVIRGIVDYITVAIHMIHTVVTVLK